MGLDLTQQPSLRLQAAVKRVLRRRKVDASQFDRLLTDVMSQAVALYKGWPMGWGKFANAIDFLYDVWSSGVE